MKVSCPNCQTTYNLDEKRIPPGGAKIKCAKCSGLFPVKPDGVASLSPSEALAQAAAIPLPGSAPTPKAPTRSSDAIPLPGNARNSMLPELGEVSLSPSSPIPLPGFAEAPASIPLPGRARTRPVFELGEESVSPPTDTAHRAIPLPGHQASTPAVSLPNLPALGEVMPHATGPIPLPDFGRGSIPAFGGSLDQPLSRAEEVPEAEPDAFDFDADLGAAATKTSDPFGESPAESDASGSAFELGSSTTDHPTDSNSFALDLPDSPSDTQHSIDFSSEEPFDMPAAEPPRPATAPDLGSDFGGIDLASGPDASGGSGEEPLETLSFDETPAPAPLPAPIQEVAPPAMLAPTPARVVTTPPHKTAARSAHKIEEPQPRQWGVIVKWAALGTAAVILLIGASFYFTPYGAFGTKVWLPNQIRANTPEAAVLAKAKKALLDDTFQSYREAQKNAEKLLLIRDYPEAKAVLAQSIFYQNRRYGTAADEVPRALASLEEVVFLGKLHPEVVKAQAGAQLLAKHPAEAEALVADLAARPENARDFEIPVLLAEAQLSAGHAKIAQQTLSKLAQAAPNSAKVQHNLGNLLAAAGNLNDAQAAYEKALAANPDHLASAIELASVQLLRNDLDASERALRPALSDKNRSGLSPSESARAYTLRGAVFSRRKQTKEALESFETARTQDPHSVFVQKHLAQELLSQREYEKAVPLFDAVLKQTKNSKDPDEPALVEGYVEALLATGQLNDALTAVQDAAGRFPNLPRLALLTGRVHEALDQPSLAETDFKRALSGDPELYVAHLALGRNNLRFRKLKEASEQFELARAKAPEAPEVQVALGELALAQDRLEDAKVAFEKAAVPGANTPEAPLGLAKVALAKGDFKVALEQAELSLAKDARVRGGRRVLGVAKWKAKDLAGALLELERARADEPKNAEVPLILGAVKFDMGEISGAETQVAASLTMDPSNPEASYQMARLKNKKAEHAQAIDLMQKALERAPSRIDYRLEYGRILKDAKKLSAAVAEWKAILKQEPKNADALAYLGTAQLESGDNKQAVEYFRAALAADPSRQAILTEIGDAYFEAALFKQAVEYYLRALKTDPSASALHFKIGRSYTELGQHPKAVEWYQKASHLDEKNPLPHWYLGYAYKEKGQKSAAVAAFKAYLTKKPEAEDKTAIEDEIYDLEH